MSCNIILVDFPKSQKIQVFVAFFGAENLDEIFGKIIQYLFPV
jgi:hypothetical protein